MDDRLRKEAGVAAEDFALEYLRAAGLKLVARNYACRGGELDLVMVDGSTLVLVEVRYRSRDDFGGAAASITWAKQRRIAHAARHLLMMRTDLRRHRARFDVIAVTGGAGRAPQIEWIKAAFALHR